MHFIYCDPHFEDNPHSHHLKQLRYFKQLMEQNRHQAVVLLRAQGKRKPSTHKFYSRQIHRVKLAIDFAANLTHLLFLVLRRRNGKVVIVNLNTDPVWLLSVAIVRWALRGDFVLRLRFIGTVDRWFFDIPSQSRYFSIVNRLLTEEDRFTAESLAYGELLSNHFQRKVIYLPYPPVDIVSAIPSQIPSKKSNQNQNALFIGAPRIDKGYLELPNILCHLVQHNWTCIVQGYEGPNQQMLEATKRMREIPGIILIDKSPSDEVVQEYILASDIVLLPYSPADYRYRNSAMNFNSLYLGKRVASYTSTALYSTADELNLAIDLKLFVENGILSFPAPKEMLSTAHVAADWIKFII